MKTTKQRKNGSASESSVFVVKFKTDEAEMIGVEAIAELGRVFPKTGWSHFYRQEATC